MTLLHETHLGMAAGACDIDPPGIGVGGTWDFTTGAVAAAAESPKVTVSFSAGAGRLSDNGTIGGTAEAGRSVSLAFVDFVTIIRSLAQTQTTRGKQHLFRIGSSKVRCGHPFLSADGRGFFIDKNMIIAASNNSGV